MAQIPTCRKCGKKLKWLPWKNGKPQQPIDPITNKPCDCWKKNGRGGDDYVSKSGRLFDKADKYVKCEYCSGWEHIDDTEQHKIHLEVYHKDKKVHRGGYIYGDSCWEDEVLYHSGGESWFMSEPDENGEFHKVDGIENVEEFCKKHGIKTIRSNYLLREGLEEDLRK